MELQTAQKEYIDKQTSDQQLLSHQKQSIVQNLLDRKCVMRVGDDPCTSGVSMSSSEVKHDSDNSNANKSFVWYAAYDSEMKDENFRECLEQCSNKSLPANQISIKLEDYDMMFAKFERVQSMVYLQHRPCSSCFIKLYLLDQDQLIDLAVHKNRMFCPEFSDFSRVNKKLIEDGDSAIINSTLPYGYFLRIGEYEGFEIYTFTNPNIQSIGDVRSTCNPSDYYIQELFEAITISFPNFSQDFLLYYLNSRKGLKTKFSKSLINQLRQHNTIPNP